MPVVIPESAGYEGTVDEPEWSDLLSMAGGRQYGVADAGAWKVTAGTADREVRIAPGRGFGYGVRDRSTAVASLTLPATTSGSRWHLIVVERDWAANQSAFDSVAGSDVRAIPPRDNTPGVTDAQPLALARVAAGQSQVADIIDLRVWGGDGGSFANDELVLQYLNRIGTSVRIGSVEWNRDLDALGNPVWVSRGGAEMPPRFEGRFRRSDGQRLLNAGTTLMRWEGTPVNTLGATATAGGSGATLVLPPGLYMVAATLRVAVNAQNYSQLILDNGGATELSSSDWEFQTPPGFYEMSVTKVLHVASAANVTVRTLSNNAGEMRIDGVFRAFRL